MPKLMVIPLVEEVGALPLFYSAEGVVLIVLLGTAGERHGGRVDRHP